MISVLAFLAAWALAAPLPKGAAELPEDLGPASVDVSSYPQEYQEIYRSLFLPVYGFLKGGPARALNSPLIELDPAGEAALRREHPELFSDPRLAAVGKDVWRKEVMRVKNRPPCCGACPVLSMDDAKKLWHFMAYDSLRRKTGENAQTWAAQRTDLIRKFEQQKKDQGEIKP